MKASIAIAAVLVSTAAAAEIPASIKNARVEAGSGSMSSAFARIGRGSTGEWLGWSVPSLPQANHCCCFSRNFTVRGCSLAEPDEGWGTTNEDGAPRASEVFVLVEAKNGRPARVRIMSPGCEIEGAGRRLVWLGPADAGASIDFLSRIATGPDEDVAQPALAAIAYHADARADAFLEKRALDRSLDEDGRQQAIFWAGQARGRRGYDLLDRVLDEEPDGDIRQHAAFALSQSDEPAAADRIQRVAVEDRDPDVRAHAYFCLSQTKMPGAGEWIVSRLDLEKNDRVREQAVFALSQLPDGTDWLLKVLRSKRDPETVRRAFFWLGQSNDPRALEEIEKILDP
jgi:HEAT repeat protein